MCVAGAHRSEACRLVSKGAIEVMSGQCVVAAPLTKRPCYVEDRDCRHCNLTKWTSVEYSTLTQFAYKMVDSMTGIDDWSIGSIRSDSAKEATDDGAGTAVVVDDKRRGIGRDTGQLQGRTICNRVVNFSSKDIDLVGQLFNIQNNESLPNCLRGNLQN